MNSNKDTVIKYNNKKDNKENRLGTNRPIWYMYRIIVQVT